MKRCWILCLLFGCLFSSRLSAQTAGETPSWKQKEFLITFWCPPPAEEKAFAAVATEHYNLTWGSAEALPLAEKHGLRLMLQDGRLNPAALDDPARRVELDALIDRVKDHPVLEAYYLTDEPGADKFADWGRLVAYLRERDPKHLAYINLFPTYASQEQLGVTLDQTDRARADCPQGWQGVGPDDPVVLAYLEHLKRFVEIVKPDLISYDHYQFFKTSDTPQYFLNLALIRRVAQEADKPFLNIVQSSTVVPVWRLPNAEEMRFLAFTTMAYGGRGISYFTYWGPKEYGGLYQDGEPAPLAADVAALNAEIEKLGPALMQLDSTGVHHTAPLPLGTEPIPADSPVKIVSEGEFVLGLFGQGEKTTAFMVVNRDYRKTAEARLQIDLPGGRVEELDRRSGKWTPVDSFSAGRQLDVQLAPGDGRFFRMVP